MGIGRKFGTWAAIAAAAGIILIFAVPSYRQGEASIAGKRAGDFPLQVDGKPAKSTANIVWMWLTVAFLAIILGTLLLPESKEIEGAMEGDAIRFGNKQCVIG